MRPIDADALKRGIEVICKDERASISAVTYFALMAFINKTPTIEAEPVERGQWIHHAGMNSKCSCCGRYFPVAEFEQRPFDVNFCIHCGARMDGDTNEEP